MHVATCGVWACANTYVSSGEIKVGTVVKRESKWLRVVSMCVYMCIYSCMIYMVYAWCVCGL